MNSFEQIKDANQLQQYLQKHAASGGMAIKATKDNNATANDYMGRQQLKQQNAADRYEKGAKPSRRTATGSVVEDATGGDLDDEQRSVHAEIDYKTKTATRHIVQKSNPASLRQKLLRNLEGVRKNKPILKSEISSMQQSIRSRLTNVSARKNAAGNGEQPLAKIDEACLGSCEICCREIADEEDMALNEEISQNLVEEDNVKNAYNAFRKKRGLAPIDFNAGQQMSAESQHKVQMCIDCLLECFQARRA